MTTFTMKTKARVIQNNGGPSPTGDAYLDAEASPEDSAPRELYEIKQNLVTTYYVTSCSRDVDYGGHTYVASPSARSEIVASPIGASNYTQLTIALPATHPLVQRYLALSSPPRQILVTVRRLQAQIGVAEMIATGIVASMAISGEVAKFMVETRFGRARRRKLPTITAGKLCQHVVYDANCRLERSTFTIGDDGPPLTIVTANGRNVTISTIGGQPDHWAKFGELVHVATGENMMVLEQVGTAITMQAPIPELNAGELVTLSAGCAHDISTCRNKFSNQVNFGGFPQMPTKNPFLPTGLGVVEQT